MPVIATRKFRVHNAEQFRESFSETGSTRYYLFIGKPTEFPDDNVPPAPIDSVRNVEYDVYRDMISMKRIQSSDVSFVVPRYNWTTGNIYRQYDDTNSTLFPTELNPASANTFYVKNSQDNVYKCIDNNLGAASTVEPTGTSTSIVSTADGYRWKYLYTISSGDALKFLTANYMPVKTLLTNDSSAQWAVQQSAASGAISHIVVTSGGSNYLSATGTISSVTNSTTFQIASSASGSDDIYNNSTIYLSGGTGSGQLRKIVNYIGGTRTVTVNTAFSVVPTNSTQYIIGPNVVIRGDSGSTSSNRATAYVSDCTGGEIRKVRVLSSGTGYNIANVAFTANSSHGSGATGYPIVPPPGGHGKDPVNELMAMNMMLSVRITGSEANSFPTSNDFRVIGIVRDPILRNGTPATASVIDQCTRIIVTGKTGEFTDDEVLIGQSSGVKSRFVRFANTNSSGTNGIVRTVRLSTTGTGGTYQASEVITGSVSGYQATVASVVAPALQEYTGDVLYIENRSPISRVPDQINDIQVVVKF